MKNVQEQEGQRTWDSVCADCKHLIDGKCAVTQTRRSPDDSLAAICRTYKKKTRIKNKITNPMQ